MHSSQEKKGRDISQILFCQLKKKKINHVEGEAFCAEVAWGTRVNCSTGSEMPSGKSKTPRPAKAPRGSPEGTGVLPPSVLRRPGCPELKTMNSFTRDAICL